MARARNVRVSTAAGSKAVASSPGSIRSALIQLFKNGTRDYQEAARQRSRRLFMGTICLSTRARAHAQGRARVYWKALGARGAGPYEHRLYSLATTSNNLPPHSAGLLSGSDRR